MIRALLALSSDTAPARRYLTMLIIGATARAVATLSLVGLLPALFIEGPTAALPWLAVMVVATASGWFIDYRTAKIAFSIGFDILTTVERRVLDRLHSIPLAWLNADRRADARRALTSAGQELCQGVGYLLTPSVNAIASPILLGIGLLFVAWPLGVIALLAVPVMLAALWGSGRISRKADAAYSDASSDVTERVVEFARHQPTLRAARRADSDGSALSNALHRQRRAALRLVGVSAPGQLLFGIASQVMVLGLAAAVAVLWLRHEINAAELVALVIVAVRFLDPFTVLADLAPAVEMFRGTLDRVMSILDAPESRITRDESVAAERGVVFENVSFRYDDTEVLDNVTFDVPNGSTTAIVGPSGSGKSTVLSLIARFGDPSSGRVFVDGRDVRSQRPEDLAARLSVVFQQVYLFDGTLRENVVMGRTEATDDEIAAAATAAGLDSVLAALPDGWDSRVGEGGSALSGGERQRVGIARAILKDAPVLLLDEATSALDTDNERQIVDALTASSGDRSTIIVAHRLDTIARADQVIFLEDGRIVEKGTPAELRALGGRFATYWRHRHEAASWHLVS